MIDKIETKKGTVLLPCMNVTIVPVSQVKANNYNPNNVSEDNMQLLLQSILDNGFCFPVVTIFDSRWFSSVSDFQRLFTCRIYSNHYSTT